MAVKGGGEVQVSEYLMSMHMGICAAGSGLELLAIKVGDKEAWRGQLRKNKVVEIDNPELFGGNKKEGGLRGLMWWLNGNLKQRLPGPLWSRLGLTASTTPGFRGLASIFFTGTLSDTDEGTDFFWPDYAALANPSGGKRGFYWTANNPYMKTISARVRRAPEGLNPSIALIQIPDDSNGNEQFGANPAHMVFECMTNREWGMGESFGAFNIGSYEQCAQTLYDEGFALDMIWTRQSKIETFIKEVLDHIQGATFVDPATGKHTMKLLRPADPEAEVLQINPSNAKLRNFKKKAWGEISNEVVVTWTNPETGKEETVTAQDLAAISMQGAQPNSSSRNYHGIPYEALAIRVAERDLAASAHPIATCDAEVTKEFWRSVVHDVVELTWPKRSIESAFFRISTVEQGSTSETVILKLYEDIFSLDRASYLSPGDRDWVNPAQPPAPLTNYQLGTAPAFMTAAALGLTDPSEIPYPEAISALTIGASGSDDIGYELVSYRTNVNGDIVRVSLGDRTLRGSWTSNIALLQTGTTLITSFPGFVGSLPRAGSFVLIGAVDDEDTEIAIIRSVTPSGYLLDRGLLDTTPKAWPIGTKMWFIPDDSEVPDTTRRSAFEVASYHFRTRTSIGLLPLADAPQIDVELTERPHMPNRPANVKVNAVAFGEVDFGTGETIPITWSRRNRANESTQVMRWTDADMAPEAGQVTRIYLMNPDRSPITTINGITGTNYTLNRQTIPLVTEAIVRVVSVRDGLESLQGHEITFTVDPVALVDLTEPAADGEWYIVTGLPGGSQLVQGDGEWWRRNTDDTIVTAARYLALFDLGEYQVEHVPGAIGTVLSLTRASAGTYVGSDGLITRAAADERRFDYLGGTRALLVEGAATNYCLRSEALNNAAWSVIGGASVTPDAISAPTGFVSADRINVTGSDQGLFQTVTVPSASDVCVSKFVKANTGTTHVLLRDDLGAGRHIQVRLSDGVVTDVSGTLAGYGVEDYGDGWMRIWMAYTTGSTAARLFIRSSNAAAGSFYAWGGQIELGSKPTSYIQTFASAVTRAADLVTMQGITDELDLQVIYDDGSTQAFNNQAVSPSYWPALTKNRVRRIIGRDS